MPGAETQTPVRIELTDYGLYNIGIIERTEFKLIESGQFRPADHNKVVNTKYKVKAPFSTNLKKVKDLLKSWSRYARMHAHAQAHV